MSVMVMVISRIPKLYSMDKMVSLIKDNIIYLMDNVLVVLFLSIYMFSEWQLL